jgi:hypothetical protein
MQSVVNGVERSGAVVFVRSLEHLSNTIRAVNQLLSLRRSRDVLGIVVHEELDKGLPTPTYGDACAGTVSLRESVGVGGIWSVCWFDFTLPEGLAQAEERRTQLLDLLVFGGSAERTGRSRLLLPVLTSAEASKGGGALIEQLSVRYPMFAVGSHGYVHDGERSTLVPLAAA